MNKKKIQTVQVIKRLIQYLQSQEVKATSSEIDEGWNEIERRVEADRKRIRICRLCIVWTSVAAMLVGAFFIINKQMRTADMADADVTDKVIEQLSPTDILPPVDSVQDIILMRGNEKGITVEANACITNDKNGTVTINSDTVDQMKNLNRQEEVFYQLITPKGKRTQLTLADGTHLHVNAATRVVYPNQFKKECREIYVEGEVYLDVAPDKGVPFIVKTNRFNVEVTGTSFNVSSYPTEPQAAVVLVQGSVSIANKRQEKVYLSPGQLIDIQADGQLDTPRNVDVKSYTCWIHNMLMYTDEPLDHVLRKLNLYYGKDFVWNDDISFIRVSGKLDLKDNVEDVLHAISYSTPIEYEERDGKIYIERKQP